jgi:acyl-CoA synthetase (NDP forming)
MSIAEKYKAGQFNKPVILSFVGGFDIEENIRKLRSMGIPIFNDVQGATACLGAIYRNHRNREAAAQQIDEVSIETEAIKQVVVAARKDGRRFLLAHEGQAVLRALGVPGPRSGIARDIDSALNLAESIGYPVVMKVVSPDIIHKSDAGGVALDIDNAEEASSAYEAILQNCQRFKADARIEGIEVSEQVKPGIETIVGARRDASFGPVVMFGLGGIYVEVMKDIAFRAFPIGRDEANAMIRQIKTYPLLLGVRGENRKDIEGTADAIIRVGTALKQVEDISDIEINPLVAYDLGEGVKAVDVRILLTRQQEA